MTPPELFFSKQEDGVRKSVPILAISVALALIPGTTAFGGHAQDSLSTQRELASTRERLLATQVELVSAREDLSATQTELAFTRASLLASQVELVSAREDILATETELASARESLLATQTELSSVKQALVSATAQVGRRYPTYGEVIQFLAEDKTDRHKFDLDSYNCRDFSADVINNAEARGIRAAYISIRLRQGSHAVVAFDTVDRGLVYFEPQTDKEVRLPLGESYLRVNGYRPPQGQDDTITRVTVIW